MNTLTLLQLRSFLSQMRHHEDSHQWVLVGDIHADTTSADVQGRACHSGEAFSLRHCYAGSVRVHSWIPYTTWKVDG